MRVPTCVCTRVQHRASHVCPRGTAGGVSGGDIGGGEGLLQGRPKHPRCGRRVHLFRSRGLRLNPDFFSVRRSWVRRSVTLGGSVRGTTVRPRPIGIALPLQDSLATKDQLGVAFGPCAHPAPTPSRSASHTCLPKTDDFMEIAQQFIFACWHQIDNYRAGARAQGSAVVFSRNFPNETIRHGISMIIHKK